MQIGLSDCPYDRQHTVIDLSTVIVDVSMITLKYVPTIINIQ